ncbi:MAG: asparagine synthase (glutamine-hydrolyzing) [Actinomycetota bacterium]|nr:asparagine synthase (glutamine-hydrolyzing) [Actinomycetota bacterium]
MCGILGILDDDLLEGHREAALDVISHRGPDDRGTWSDEQVWLGHRRLSIIDAAGGHQPMVDPTTGVVVTYNGEIYNYLELRRELEAAGHRFVSSSDTEVLLHGYLEWGTGCLEHFNGMWAFIIWDPRSRQAFFARDRFGVKPLYYALHGGSLLIGSEPKALITACPALRQVNESAIHDLLADKRVWHDERTFYADILALAAGHWGTYRPGERGPRIERYWADPAPSCTGPWDEADALERFAAVLEDAVAIRLRSDVPVGLTVSGGIDSTVILDAMAAVRGRTGSDVRSYTAVYGEMPEERSVDESSWARIAASAYGNVVLEEVEASNRDWLEVLRRIVWHMDGPGFSPAVFPMWMIMQRARADGVPVLLEGQGADEVFGGYAYYTAAAFLDRLTERRPSASVARAGLDAARAGSRASSARGFLRDVGVVAVPAVRDWQSRRSTLRGALAARNRHEGRRRLGEGRGGPGVFAAGRFERRLGSDFSHDLLPAFLQYGDAVSMAHSIETRLPFLDYRLVELGMALPPPARISVGETKHLLRSHLRRAGQDEIADRRGKRGYPTPAHEWLAADGGAVLRGVLLDRGARVGEMINPARVERTIDRHVAGSYAGGDALYSLLATELWWQQVTP